MPVEWPDTWFARKNQKVFLTYCVRHLVSTNISSIQLDHNNADLCICAQIIHYVHITQQEVISLRYFLTLYNTGSPTRYPDSNYFPWFTKYIWYNDVFRMLYNIITSQPIEDFLAERRGATRPLSFDFTWMHFTVIILSYVREAHHMSSWIPYRHSEYTFLKTPMHKNTHPPTHTHTHTHRWSMWGVWNEKPELWQLCADELRQVT